MDKILNIIAICIIFLCLFVESRPYNSHHKCTPDMFHCNNGSCLNKTRICDLTPDCAEGEDEILECGRLLI